MLVRGRADNVAQPPSAHVAHPPSLKCGTAALGCVTVAFGDHFALSIYGVIARKKFRTGSPGTKTFDRTT